MTQLHWDQAGERKFETGVSKGVLYRQNPTSGAYDTGFAWNGLTSITDSPSGAEANKSYADNIVYANITSAEEAGGTINAFTYPDEFAECDGSAVPVAGVKLRQQSRKPFGLSYQSLIGNDIEGTDYGFKLHLVWGATATPSEVEHATVNDSPEPAELSWEYTTLPVEVPGFKPSAAMEIDSTDVDPTRLAAFLDILYGTAGSDPRLPLPAEVIAHFEAATVTTITPSKPTNVGNVITIPAVTGAQYKLNGKNVAAGALPAITADAIVSVVALPGYKFPAAYDSDWSYTYTP